MLKLTVIENRFECTVELPLTEQPVLQSVLETVVEFVQKLTYNQEGDHQ
jgi:hypothetical protein